MTQADVDGKTRESMGLGPIEFNAEANASTEAASAAEAATLPQPSSTTPFGNAGIAPAETGCGEGTMSWTQAIREGFLELPDGEVLPSIS